MEGGGSGEFGPALLSLPEVARYLHMQERTIYDWAQTGRIPAYKLGAAWRFRRSEIDAWLETQRSGPVVGSGKPPLVPPATPPVPAFQAHREQIEGRREAIEMEMHDGSRTVFLVDEFAERFGAAIVQEVMERLVKEQPVVASLRRQESPIHQPQVMNGGTGMQRYDEAGRPKSMEDLVEYAGMFFDPRIPASEKDELAFRTKDDWVRLGKKVDGDTDVRPGLRIIVCDVCGEEYPAGRLKVKDPRRCRPCAEYYRETGRDRNPPSVRTVMRTV